MPFHILCPACKHAHNAPSEIPFGRKVKCSACKFLFPVGKETIVETDPPRQHTIHIPTEIPETVAANPVVEPTWEEVKSVEEVESSAVEEMTQRDRDLAAFHERMNAERFTAEQKPPLIPAAIPEPSPKTIDPQPAETIKILRQLCMAVGFICVIGLFCFPPHTPYYFEQGNLGRFQSDNAYGATANALEEMLKQNKRTLAAVESISRSTETNTYLLRATIILLVMLVLKPRK